MNKLYRLYEEKKGKKTRQGVSANSKGHKKYRGQGGRPKRRKKQ